MDCMNKNNLPVASIEKPETIETTDILQMLEPIFTPPENLVFVDIETSGSVTHADRITEIGVVRVDKNGVHEWSSLVNPQQKITPFVVQLTGITDKMVQHAPTFAEIAETLQQQLNGALFIAHNARFDYNFIRREFEMLGMAFNAPQLCTVKLSRHLFPEHKKHGLSCLIERFNLSDKDRHRALADARLLWILWQLWRDKLTEKIYLRALNLPKKEIVKT